MSEGYAPRPYDELRAELERRVRRRSGADVDLSEGELPGQVLSLLALRLAQADEAAATLRESRDPDAATGSPLDSLLALAGLERQSGELDGAARARREDVLSAPSATSWDELYTQLLAVDEIFDVAIIDVASFRQEIHVISASAAAVWDDAVGAVLLEHLAAGTQLDDPGSAALVQVADSAGVTQDFRVTLNQGDVTAILDINITAPAGLFVESALLDAALPPLLDEDGEPFALELAGGARVTRFGFPIVRSDVICRLRKAFPQIVDIQVQTTALALDVDVPLAEDEAALWDVANFTITLNEQ